MGLIVKQLAVDLWQKILQPVTVVQHEASGRTLAISLAGGGLPVNLTACDVVFYARKPDGNILFNNCDVVDAAAGEIGYTITEQTVAAAGVLKCWIVVTKDGATIRSQEFNITVQECPDFTGAVESTSEFSDLEAALATLAAFDARVTAAEGNIDALNTELGYTNYNISVGWMPFGVTLEYISPTSFRLPGDYSGILGFGDKIMLTQTTAKFFYVYSAAYDGGTGFTTVTVIGGSDYTVANAAITSPYFSKAETPIGFPSKFNWSPTYSASGSMTYTAVTTSMAEFRISGSIIKIDLYASGTTGGTASNTIQFTPPLPAVVTYGAFTANIADGGNLQSGMAALINSTTIVSVRKYDASTWGLNTGRIISVSGECRAAA